MQQLARTLCEGEALMQAGDLEHLGPALLLEGAAAAGNYLLMVDTQSAGRCQLGYFLVDRVKTG